MRGRRCAMSLCVVVAGGLGLASSPADAALSATQSPSRVEWQELSPPSSPSARAYAATAYDSKNDLVVMEGGNTGGGGSPDTWLFDGDNWSKPALAVYPDYRETASMAYDAARNETVLYGGTCDCDIDAYGDTWVFDGKQWAQRTPAESPPPLYGAALAYDPINKNVVLFGGSLGGAANLSAQTWVWDGVTWTQQHPKTSPPARYVAGAAYSKARQAVVIFGGQDPTYEPLNDTWSWDGKTWTKDKSTPVISPRLAPGMSSYGRRVVVFGGYSHVPDEYYDDTWVLGAKGWRLRAKGSAGPSGRTTTSMVYDSERDRVVMFGGINDSGFLGDTWTLQTD